MAVGTHTESDTTCACRGRAVCGRTARAAPPFPHSVLLRLDPPLPGSYPKLGRKCETGICQTHAFYPRNPGIEWTQREREQGTLAWEQPALAPACHPQLSTRAYLPSAPTLRVRFEKTTSIWKGQEDRSDSSESKREAPGGFLEGSVRSRSQS